MVLPRQWPAWTKFQKMCVACRPPPPPPEDDALRANRAIRAHQTRTDLDDTGVADAPERSDVSELDKERWGELSHVAEIIRDLSAQHVQLKSLLGAAYTKVRSQAEAVREEAGINVYATSASGKSYASSDSFEASANPENRVQDYASSTAGVEASYAELASQYHGRDSQNAGAEAATNDKDDYDLTAISRKPRWYTANKYGPGTGRRMDERRLWEQDWNVRDPDLTSNYVAHPIMQYGALGGLTLAECSAICEALRRNASDSPGQEECQAFAWRYERPDVITDSTLVECYLLRNTGSCSAVDFAARIWSRKYDDNNDCDDPVHSKSHPLCLEISAMNENARVLDHDGSYDICQNNENGKGQLPLPRSKLESMNMVAYARQQGVSSFWSASPVDNSVDVDLHWADEFGNTLVYRAGDTRCVLIDSHPGIAGSMFASVQPCHARKADGVVCEAATNMPPPPAFGVAPPDAYYRAPAPPPPPLVKAESRRMFVKEMVRPRTELICSGIEQGPERRAACREFAHYMATPRTYAFIPVFTAFCEPNLCWSSCGGQGSTDTEGWHDCKDAKCADASCLDFLKRECPSGMLEELQKIHDDECTLHPPLPPQPKPPPPPPTANPAPPEILDYFQRVAKDELDSDADCLPVSYETCQKVVQRFMDSLGGPNQLYTGVLDVSLAPCEGKCCQILTTAYVHTPLLCSLHPHTPFQCTTGTTNIALPTVNGLLPVYSGFDYVGLIQAKHVYAFLCNIFFFDNIIGHGCLKIHRVLVSYCSKMVWSINLDNSTDAIVALNRHVKSQWSITRTATIFWYQWSNKR